MNSTSQAPNDDSIDLAQLFWRIIRGIPQTVGLALLGLTVAAAAFFLAGPVQESVTTTRVVFSFPGFELGQYPDGSKFDPDAIRSAEVISEALNRAGLGSDQNYQSKIRAALTIEGLIPPSVIKDRDRLRSTGVTPPLYVPDEYHITLLLPRDFVLTTLERETLLNEIISVFQENFTRTYVAMPLDHGRAFESLEGADYFEYELVLQRESQNIETFLTQMSEEARAFRSPRSNLTFHDLLKQSQLFSQLRLNEVLGLISRDGLSRNRELALVKMRYYLKTLLDEEHKAQEEEKVVQELLRQAQERDQNYALGVKSQATSQKNGAVVIDQGLVDSLLVNDAYNFLVRETMDASFKTRRLEVERKILEQRLKQMENGDSEQLESSATFEAALIRLKSVYDRLMADIQITYDDYQQQQFSDAIQISRNVQTSSYYLSLAKAGIAGGGVGCAMGLGLTLIGINLASRRSS
jgi:hypothetical protein